MTPEKLPGRDLKSRCKLLQCLQIQLRLAFLEDGYMAPLKCRPFGYYALTKAGSLPRRLYICHHLCARNGALAVNAKRDLRTLWGIKERRQLHS